MPSFLKMFSSHIRKLTKGLNYSNHYNEIELSFMDVNITYNIPLHTADALLIIGGSFSKTR